MSGGKRLKKGVDELVEIPVLPDDTIPFESKHVKAYLDKAIMFWRESPNEFRVYYIDAFQSVRKTLFGETLPGD
jgi:hypothetical protein